MIDEVQKSLNYVKLIVQNTILKRGGFEDPELDKYISIIEQKLNQDHLKAISLIVLGLRELAA